MSKAKKRNLLTLLRWHRRIGAILVLIIVCLSVSGILINHSQQMGLHKKPVLSSWLARLYGLPLDQVESGFEVNQHWLSQINATLYFNRSATIKCESLIGAVPYQEEIAVLCSNALVLLDNAGELVESLPMPEPGSSRLGLWESLLVVEARLGLLVFNEEELAWVAFNDAKPVQWVAPALLPEKLSAALNKKGGVRGLSWEQVLLDFHSGRLFGNAGVWVVDMSALLMVLLALSGLVTYLNRIKRRFK